MWLQYIENANTIKSVLNNEIPELGDIMLHELVFKSGEDISIYLRFDLDGIKNILPKKWVEKGYNSVQITLLLVNSSLNYFNQPKTGKFVGSLKIDKIRDTKILKFINISNELLFEIETKFIYIDKINGYKKSD